MVDRPQFHKEEGRLHETHPTSVAFFDEAGAISSDRFFAVGLLRLEDHSNVLKGVKNIRKRHKFWDEFKWAELTSTNVAPTTDVLDLLIDKDVNFSCFIADRTVADPVQRFGNQFAAYEKLATQLLIGSVRPFELVSVLADRYSAPDYVDFEWNVKEECNRRLRRLAVTSVVQVDSGATEGLQLVDLLVGAIAFNFKADAGLASKRSLKGRTAASVLSRLDVTSFDEGGRVGNFNIRRYEHEEWERQQKKKRKRRRVMRLPRRGA
jgi:hypothetical protein